MLRIVSFAKDIVLAIPRAVNKTFGITKQNLLEFAPSPSLPVSIIKPIKVEPIPPTDIKPIQFPERLPCLESDSTATPVIQNGGMNMNHSNERDLSEFARDNFLFRLIPELLQSPDPVRKETISQLPTSYQSRLNELMDEYRFLCDPSVPKELSEEEKLRKALEEAEATNRILQEGNKTLLEELEAERSAKNNKIKHLESRNKELEDKLDALCEELEVFQEHERRLMVKELEFLKLQSDFELAIEVLRAVRHIAGDKHKGMDGLLTGKISPDRKKKFQELMKKLDQPSSEESGT